MIGTLRKFFSSNGSSRNGGVRESKNLAKSRLSFVLVQDRTGLTQDEISNFKREMVAVIEKYFVIDETGLDVSYKRETDSTMLVINSPVVVKRQDGFRNRAGTKHANSGKADAAKTQETTIASKSAEANSEIVADSAVVNSTVAAEVVAQSVEADKQAVG